MICLQRNNEGVNIQKITSAMGTLWNLQCQLLVAIQNNDLARVHALLEQGVDSDVRFQIGSQKRPAICLCAERGNLSMVQLLVRWGCSINQSDSSGSTPLHIATNHGHEDLVYILLKNRANVRAVSALGYTPLHLAAQRTSISIMQMLIEANAEIDRPDHEGKTALVHACIQGNVEMIKYLVEVGAKVNTCDIFGNSPLLFATSALLINLDVVHTLVEHGAKVDQYNKSGETPLHAAITGRRGRKNDVLKALISTGCDLNLRTGLGHTALHLAVLEHEYILVEMLVRAGCCVSTHDELGLTPLFHLARDGKQSLVQMLLAAGANISSETWLQDAKRVAEIKDEELKSWLQSSLSRCPELTLLCRKTLRSYLGQQADDTFQNLKLPVILRDYLMLKVL